MAVVVPFTETFSSSAANWSTSAASPATTPLTYPASGGPDGSAYGSGSFGFTSTSVGSTPILFRAQTSFGASGSAFNGNWLTGVSTFSFSVRHNVPGNLTFFARWLAEGAFTGVVYQVPATLAPNTWGTYSVSINPATAFIYEGSPALFNTTFSNINRVQIGVIGDASIAGQTGPFTFDIDNVSVVPAPAGAAIIGLGGLGVMRRRR
jgi:MYXO-CTERM domain-containing protein